MPKLVTSYVEYSIREGVQFVKILFFIRKDVWPSFKCKTFMNIFIALVTRKAQVVTLTLT